MTRRRMTNIIKSCCALYLANGAQCRKRRGPVENAAAAVSANPRAGRRTRRAKACEQSTCGKFCLFDYERTMVRFYFV